MCADAERSHQHWLERKAWSGFLAVQRKKPERIGTEAPLPGFIDPALASSITEVPTGERSVHEIKFDGYRVR